MKCTLPVATLEQARGRRLHFVLDTERTGDFFLRGQDVVFAAAVAVTVELDDDRLYVVRELCARWIQPLPYVEGQTLEECWRANRWEQRCLDEFWSKEGPTAMFHALVAAATPALSVANEVRAHVFLLEATAAAYSCTYAWYVDCIAVDAWWLNWLMLVADGKPMNYRRSGKYGLDIFDLDSMFAGATATFTDPLRREGAWNVIRDRAARDSPHSHDPLDDALNIAAQFYHLPRVVREYVASATAVI